MKERYIHALLDMAERFGQTSSAERLKVGALLFKNDSIISLGVNGQPPNWHTEVCEDDCGNTLPTVRHAEQAALEKLWNSNETARGSSMFVSHSPCLPCSIKIVTAGIQQVFYRYDYRDLTGVQYLVNNGVIVKQVKGNENE